MMLQRTWEEVQAAGYWLPASMRQQIEPYLLCWFSSCLAVHGGIALRPELCPREQLSLYLFGEVGKRIIQLSNHGAQGANAPFVQSSVMVSAGVVAGSGESSLVPPV